MRVLRRGGEVVLGGGRKGIVCGLQSLNGSVEVGLKRVR